MIQLNRKWWIWLLRIEVVVGLIALMIFFSWWLIDDRLASAFYIVWFLFAFVYASTQLVANWVLYLAAKFPPPPPTQQKGITVDVFVTAYNEPYDMVERSLTAICSLEGEYLPWLLDDGRNPDLKLLATRLGAGYLTREGNEHAKAGNLNAALAQTSGDIIAIFDCDHAPQPEFLKRSLGYFDDPEIGFVQVMLTFNFDPGNWVAVAAMETSLDYYNPTSIGSAEVGGASMMGSNALIRRKALDSIGGYQPGLAEDLATSLALHAAGWKSAYLAEPLAPGIAPPSYTAWFTQQLKWARGVFELLLTVYPRVFSRLNWGQRLSYLNRMGRYWIGPVAAAHLFATIGVLIFANPSQRDAFHQYLDFLAPVVIIDILIRATAFRIFRYVEHPHLPLYRALILVYATWPVYTLAWGMALLRIPLSFRPTPKTAAGRLHPVWLLPQLLSIILLVIGTLYTTIVLHHPLSILLVIAILQAGLHLFLVQSWNEVIPIRDSDPRQRSV